VDHVALSSFFRDLFESIGLRRRASQLGLRPHREVLLELRIDAAFDRTLDAFTRVLGANVSTADRESHAIEAGFGLVNQERVRATMEPADDTHTRIRIEAMYPAGMTPHERSASVDALADALSR
jgi:hypothetical protein